MSLDGARMSLDGRGQERGTAGLRSNGSDLDRKYWVALGLYAVLAALVWFTMSGGAVLVKGRSVELRWLPLIVIGGMALRTVLARQAEKIRRGGGGNSSSTP